MSGSLDFKSAADSALSGLAGASPFGAAANAIKGLAAGGPSQSGDSTSGGTFGTVNIAGIGSSVATPIGGMPIWAIALGAALIVGAAIYLRR